jgi:TrmH family RNA methyltransferase
LVLGKVVVVLVEPQHPGNVGAVARAMKNMGLSRLVLVAPPAWDPHRARWMAPGCDAIIAGSRLVATLDQALEGVHRAVAATARHRRHGQPVLEPRELGAELLADARSADPEDRLTAILFGREDHGLSAEATARCDALLRIATPEHASLNLSQAVLIVAHALFEAAREGGAAASGRTLGGHVDSATRALAPRAAPAADLATVEPAMTELVALLDRVAFTRASGPERVALTARLALQRTRVTTHEVSLLRGMIARITWALDHPG